jgi:hypothetical protein
MRGAIPPLPHYTFMARCSDKNKSARPTLPFIYIVHYILIARSIIRIHINVVKTAEDI